MSSRRDDSKRKLIAELRKVPLIQIACQRAGVARATYYRWRNEDPDFKAISDEALAEGTDVINDLAESKVIAGINNNDQKYVFFWLNNRHAKYHLQRGPHMPTNLDLLEAKLRSETEKFQKLIKEFLDDPDNLPGD